MNFIEALKNCGGSTKRVRSPVVDARGSDSESRTKIYRPEWEKIKFPAKYVWVTTQNIPMISIGKGQSMPLMLEVSDFLADDWEILEKL